jgi:hypothetical protein
MISRLLTAITRKLVVSEGEHGHFHPGPRGPYPCYDPGCRTSRR